LTFDENRIPRGDETMVRCRRVLILGTLLAVGAFATPSAQKPDPSVGAWKLNVAKSKYDPGPAPKSQVLRFEAWDGGLKLTADGVDAAGNATHSEYAAKFDGKDYPWKGNVNADSISLKRIDERTIESQWKKGGKPTITSRAVISADGKTRTSTQTGVDAQGRKVNNIVVHEKQ
jgi:hypothetical protein